MTSETTNDFDYFYRELYPRMIRKHPKAFSSTGSDNTIYDPNSTLHALTATWEQLGVEHTYQPVCMTLTGSRLYGIETPESDHDYSGIYVLTPLQLCSPISHKDSRNSKDESIKWVEIRKWANQLMNGKPTALEILLAYGTYGSTYGEWDMGKLLRRVWPLLDRNLFALNYFRMTLAILRDLDHSVYVDEVEIKKMFTRAMYYLLLGIHMFRTEHMPPNLRMATLRIVVTRARVDTHLVSCIRAGLTHIESDRPTDRFPRYQKISEMVQVLVEEVHEPIAKYSHRTELFNELNLFIASDVCGLVERQIEYRVGDFVMASKYHRGPLEIVEVHNDRVVVGRHSRVAMSKLHVRPATGLELQEFKQQSNVFEVSDESK